MPVDWNIISVFFSPLLDAPIVECLFVPAAWSVAHKHNVLSIWKAVLQGGKFSLCLSMEYAPNQNQGKQITPKLNNKASIQKFTE